MRRLERPEPLPDLLLRVPRVPGTKQEDPGSHFFTYVGQDDDDDDDDDNDGVYDDDDAQSYHFFLLFL